MAWSDTGALTMGYYDTQKLPLYPFAKQYTLADNYFSSVFGGSMLNHFWLICACTPCWDNAPEKFIAARNLTRRHVIDPGETVVNVEGIVTPDGFLVNDVDPRYKPHGATELDELAPPQEAVTIGDRLEQKICRGLGMRRVERRYAGHPDKLYIFEHQPFVYYKQFGDGTAAKAEHLLDSDGFFTSLQNGSLPDVRT